MKFTENLYGNPVLSRRCQVRLVKCLFYCPDCSVVMLCCFGHGIKHKAVFDSFDLTPRLMIDLNIFVPLLMTLFAKCYKVFRLITATNTNRGDMVNFKLPVINRDRHTVLIDIGVKLAAILTSEIVPVFHPQRIWVTTTIPHSHVCKLLSAFVTAEAPSFVIDFTTTPRALILLFIVWRRIRNSLFSIQISGNIQSRKRPAFTVYFPIPFHITPAFIISFTA
nr:MAG TPA: hypothetical protein [Caudoviricetes sp.]